MRVAEVEVDKSLSVEELAVEYQRKLWPMPPYYSYYLPLLYSTSIEDSRCWLRTANTLTYGYSKNTRPMREACEASTNSVLLLLIGLIR